MKLTFESNLGYQQDAIRAVVDLFEGQTLCDSDCNLKENGVLDLIAGIGNRLVLDESQILANLQKVQERNDIPVSEKLSGMHFSIEMETGTGKTYVYLRTIYELNRKYTMFLFVIMYMTGIRYPN